MGNFLPCGGLSDERQHSLSNRGRDGSCCSASNGGAIVPTGNFPLSENNGKYDSEALLRRSSGTNNVSSQSVLQWKRTENTTYKDLRMRRPKIKAVVGLSKQSSTYEAVKWALDRLGIESTHSQTTEGCINSCVVSSSSLTSGNNLNPATIHNNTTNTSNHLNKREALFPILVLLDLKATKDFDPESVSRSIRNSNQGQHVVIIGIVKRSVLEKEEDTITSYLQSGFNRILSDNSNRGYWLNEITMLISNEIDNAVRLRTLETLLTALDNCSDMVQITDHEDKIIFQNSVGERVLGYSSSDYASGDRHLWDFQSTAAMYSHAVLEENDTACPDNNTSGKELVQQKLNQGLIWEGHLSCKRKSGDLLPCESRIVPINFSCQKDPDQIVYVKKVPSSSAENTRTNSIIDSHLLNQKRRKSLKSFRNASLDIGSYLHPDGIIMNTARRQSNALSVGSTPLNKVITIILAAQKTSPIYVAQALDEVLEILQSTSSTDLFAPEIEEGQLKKTADPVTSDLLEALLSNSTRDVPSNNMTSQGRRQSAGRPSLNGVSQLPALQASNTTTPKSSPYLSPVDARLDRSKPSQTETPDSSTDRLHNLISVGTQSGVGGVTEEARKAVEKCHMWDFDVIQLETITNHRCLVWLGMATFLRFELHKTLRCSETTLQNWLALIEANYHRSNSYHNSTHASDVLHATAFFLEQDKLKEICDDVDGAICLLAAAIHDVDHPGKNSAFLCNSNSELAKLYNDITVLENHHAALGFKLTTSDDRVNILKNLDRDTYKVVRQGIIDLVLATDMSKHFIHLNKFATLYGRLQEDSATDSADSPEPPGGPNKDADNQQIILADISNSPENMATVKRMLIKCADVSNPARPLNICRQWAYRIAEEYFTQTEEEKRLGMPVVMPQFDRTTCSIPKSQIGFYNFFINDMFEMWNGFADLEMLSDIIKENYSYWELECQKEENSNEEDGNSSKTAMDKKSTEEPLSSSTSSKKEATPSNENNTLTTESSRSTSRKENEENSCNEANKST